VPVPTDQDFLLPVLAFVQNVATHTARSLRDGLGNQFELTEDERREMSPSGNQTVLHSRIHWACYYLKRAGLLQAVKRGEYQITERSRTLLDEAPSTLTNQDLMAFPEFAAWYRPHGSKVGALTHRHRERQDAEVHQPGVREGSGRGCVLVVVDLPCSHPGGYCTTDQRQGVEPEGPVHASRAETLRSQEEVAELEDSNQHAPQSRQHHGCLRPICGSRMGPRHDGHPRGQKAGVGGDVERDQNLINPRYPRTLDLFGHHTHEEDHGNITEQRRRQDKNPAQPVRNPPQLVVLMRPGMSWLPEFSFR